MKLEELQGLLRVLQEAGVAEFELEEQGVKLRVRTSVAPAQPLPAAVSAPMMVAAAPALPSGTTQVSASELPPPVEQPDASLTIVKSPIVGTFYRASDPNTPPFVQVGDRVRVGQVLCIIEAMKLMNEIESEVAGEIVRVHHENGQPVQYGEPLFSVRP